MPCVVLSLFAALLLLAGCADFGRIAPKQSAATVQSLQARTLPAAQAASGWWRVFGDAQLQALIEQALSSNPGLQALRTRAEQAAYYTQIASGENQPIVALDAAPLRQHASANQTSPYADRTYWSNRAVIDLSLNLDLWGRQKSVIAASVGELRAAEFEAQFVQQQLTTALIQLYAGLGVQHELLDLAQAEERRLRHAQALAGRRLAAGLGSGQERERLAFERERQARSVAAIKAQIELAQHQLAAMAGLAATTGENLARPQLKDGDALQLPAAVPADWAGRRPDLAAQRWRVEAARHDVDAAKAAFYPNIDLLAFAGFQTVGFGKFFANSSATQGVGAAFSLPLFDQGRLRGRLGVETGAYDLAVETYNQTLLAALQQIADQASKLQSDAQQLASARHAQAHAQRQYAAAAKAYAAGITSLDPVLDAEARLIAAREAEALVTAQRRVDYAGLMLAIGGDIPSAESARNP